MGTRRRGPRDLGASGWYRAGVPGRRLYVTDAIVLSRFDFGEADRIMTLLTPELGEIKAIAKGIRRPTSRIGGALEPLAELRLQLAKGRTFDVVTQVTMQHSWLGLRDKLEVTATAWYCAELAERSLEERHAALPVYLLLRRTYELLDAGMAPARVARWFEDAALRRAGRPAGGGPLRRVRPPARPGRRGSLGPRARRRPVSPTTPGRRPRQPGSRLRR